MCSTSKESRIRMGLHGRDHMKANFEKREVINKTINAVMD
jgi:hypothetical protein